MFVVVLTTRQLMHFLKMKSEDTIIWLSENQVMVNWGKSKIIVMSKKESDQGKDKILVAK